MFNVSNALAAVASCHAVGLSMREIRTALETCTGVRGRCEVIPTGRDFTVICDYAHTPDAVENILRSVKEYTKGRLICLFGCGGNRDATKRPKMAKAAAYLQGRNYVIPSDVMDVFEDVALHRIILNMKAKVGHIRTEELIRRIVEQVQQPSIQKRR